jgi:hypothetical protein
MAEAAAIRLSAFLRINGGRRRAAGR